MTVSVPSSTIQRLALLCGALALAVLLSLLTAPGALAAPTDTSEWAGKITDSQGVPLEKYGSLPLDRGDHWTPQKWVPSFLQDLIWGLHMGLVQVVFTALHLLMSFEWISWISAPVNMLATNLSDFLSRIHWVGFAAMIMGFAAAMLIIRGRTSSGVSELVVGSLMVALAGGLLANPVQWITGPDGLFAKVQEYGGQAAVEITSDPQNRPPKGMAVKDALNQTIMSQLTDLYVRDPAQAAAFGHTLSGECDQIFTENMKKVDPIDVGDTTVRSRVSSCDDMAKTYVESPAVAKVFPLMAIGLGGGTLLLLSLALAGAYFLAVLLSLFQGLRQLWTVMIAILPGTRRSGFFSAFIFTFLYALLVGVLMVVNAAYLMMLVGIASATSHIGIVAQMGVVSLGVVVLIILMFLIWRRSKKSGQKLAEKLASLGTGDSTRPAPVKFNPMAKIEPWIRDGINRKMLHGRIAPPYPSAPAPALASGPAPQPMPGSVPATASSWKPQGSAQLPQPPARKALGVGGSQPPQDPPTAPQAPTGPKSPVSPSAPGSAKALRALSAGLSLVPGATSAGVGLVARGAAGALEKRSSARSQSAPDVLPGSASQTVSPQLPGRGARGLVPLADGRSPLGSAAAAGARRIEVGPDGRGRVIQPALEGRIVPASQGPTRVQRSHTPASDRSEQMRRQLAQARMRAAARSMADAR